MRAATEIADARASEPTIRSTWQPASGRPASDELLGWPADVFALSAVILDRTEAYRFVVSPPPAHHWPPGPADWSTVVRSAGRSWAERMEPPELVKNEWRMLRRALDTRLDDIASGRAWRTCVALLTLHAVADEACAGVATAEPDDDGVVLRARMRELLARTGSIARIDPNYLRVLPKYRTAPGGITSRSISRYASLAPSRVAYSVQRVTMGRPGEEQLKALLLPWPMRMADTDFRPLAASVRERDTEPFGYFRYSPAEPFDVSLVDRLLTSAFEHVDRVDIVIAPESSVPREVLPQLEALLAERGVPMLIAGLRDRPDPASGLAPNWVHFGASLDGKWWHYRQDKHHRWSLDRSQIEQYHLTDVLDPRVRWWEAMDIQRRSLQIIEHGNGQTIASLVCEDLAQLDDSAQLLQAVGPTLVIALLLDGPQLASRWTGRYASVLADDPGSAVLTLTTRGMATSSWRTSHKPSTAVASWRDSAHRRPQEINLEPGAQGLLLRLDTGRSLRRAADGRLPEHDAADIRLAEVVQLRATDREGTLPAIKPAEPSLSANDLTVLLSWAEAIDHARGTDPTAAVTASARPGASWREELQLPEPTGALAATLSALAALG
jgi:hypothetical protein